MDIKEQLTELLSDIAKTREDLVTQITNRIKELHPYSCPCIVALPLIGGNPDFLSWIISETEK